jgi:hypothetical protein
MHGQHYYLVRRTIDERLTPRGREIIVSRSLTGLELFKNSKGFKYMESSFRWKEDRGFSSHRHRIKPFRGTSGLKTVVGLARIRKYG